MKIKYISEQIPSKYSNIKPINASVQKTYQGKKYQLIGASENKFTLLHRCWLAVRTLFKIVVTLGLALVFARVRDDVVSCWKGKREVTLYSCSSELVLNQKMKSMTPEECYDMAREFKKGKNGQKDESELAMQAYAHSAEKGLVEAQIKLGRIYEKGVRVAQSKENALIYFVMAADQGHEEGQFRAGILYHTVDSLKDDDKAFKYLKMAAKHSSAKAQFGLAMMYQLGCGVKEDRIMANILLKLAAKKGMREAEYALGIKYIYGDAVKKSDAKAVKYMTLSADKGLTAAQILISNLYYKGMGVKCCHDTALRYAKLSKTGSPLDEWLKIN